jgi:perosamine synthetase
MAEQLNAKPGDFPVCEYVSARTLALPFFSRMTDPQIDRVCEALETVLDRTLTGRKTRF